MAQVCFPTLKRKKQKSLNKLILYLKKTKKTVSFSNGLTHLSHGTSATLLILSSTTVCYLLVP